MSEPIIHTAFYQFVTIENPERLANGLRDLCRLALGSILVAHEGINGTLAGSALVIDEIENQLKSDPRFATMCFKRSSCKTAPFARLKIHVKPAIVAIGAEPAASDPNVVQSPAHVLRPEAWREFIKRDDVVLIDNRNSFEFRLGRFAGAIDPGVKHYSDFARYVEQNLPAWQAADKKVAMYCTGGIRCEKTAAWMSGLGAEVYQLDGGILNYFANMPDAEKDFHGECFVFDNRLSLDTKLQETDTSIDDIYAAEPDGAWRIARAKKLREALR